MPRSLFAVAVAVAVALPTVSTAQTFQPGRLPTAAADSFEIIFQGRPIGTFVTRLAKTGNDFTFVADAELAAMGLRQVDSVVFNATTLTPVLMAGRTDLPSGFEQMRATVADGKATGSVQGRNGTTKIDVAVPPGVIPDGAEIALLPTVDFSEGLTAMFQTLEPKVARVKSYELTILGKESVSVPAGTFDAWKAQLVSDETVVAWISAAEPHRILMLRLEGAQMEMRRVR